MRISNIIIPKGRQRKEFLREDIDELQVSIERLGLIHPIVVADDGVTLVAGQRRVLAVTQIKRNYYHGRNMIGPGHIPATLLRDLTPVERFEIELEENIRRTDLTPIERADAIAKLHKLRIDEHGERTHSSQMDGWAKKDTAREFAKLEGRQASSHDETEVARAILISEHSNDPDVRKAKSTKEAEAIIRKKLRSEFRAAQAGLSAEEVSSSPHRVFPSDGIEILGRLNDGALTGIIADPPYGVGADSFGSQGGTLHDKHKYHDTLEAFTSIADGIAENRDKFSPTGAVYIFHDYKHFWGMYRIFQANDWNVWPYPIIWDKGNGIIPDHLHGPRRTYECIFYAYCEEHELFKVFNDVIHIPSVAHKIHQAQKPVELYEDLIIRSFPPGSLIYDPCAGSGTIFEAADRQGCIAYGAETSQEYFNLCVQRINEL
ncbi:MAG: DNA modification methylase [Planctomycetes bacterium]|nr:DNA modification methylase [Planctomycetota bacterium]